MDEENVARIRTREVIQTCNAFLNDEMSWNDFRSQVCSQLGLRKKED